MAIDWSFLQSVEGKENTTYIPENNGKVIQDSGVTVGTGVDLGHQSEAKFKKLGISDEVIAKLKPFFGKRKEKAQKALAKAGDVTLTDEEVFAIDKALKQDTLNSVKRWYNRDNKLGQDWSDLSDRQQTVVLSTFYNHGLDGAPNFKSQIEAGDWSAAIENLRNFYPTKENELHRRRVKEAQFLAGLPPKEIDGWDGPTTEAAVEKFKNTVGVSTPDQVQPQQPQIGSVEYIDNLMQTLSAKLKGSQGGREAPSEADIEPESQFTEEEENLIDSVLSSVGSGVEESPENVEFTPAELRLIEQASGVPTRRAEDEARLERTANEAKLAATAREAEVEASAETRPDTERRATGTRETERPVRSKPQGGQNDRSKDPTFGIF